MNANDSPKLRFGSTAMRSMSVSNYTICKNIRIGQGAFSIVYMGYKDDTSKRVAIKEICLDKISNSLRERFYEEMNIMHILKKNPHKNVVECYDIEHRLNKIYIIMEYCTVGELSKVINKNMSEDKAKFYFKQIIEGILHLNKLNIVHRDIKPANILITAEDTIKITDFGLSRILTNNDLLNTMCGSPFYMSPELLNNNSYNRDSDTWSLGIILYELIYGYHPFRYCNDINELKQVHKDHQIIYLPYNQNNIKISYKCMDLMKKLLDKNTITRINIEDVLKHIWFIEEKTVHDFVLIEDYFDYDKKESYDDNIVIDENNTFDEVDNVPKQLLCPISANNDCNKSEYKYLPSSAPTTWSMKVMESIWNFGNSTFGYISKFGTAFN